jgi:hypothetical protein
VPIGIACDMMRDGRREALDMGGESACLPHGAGSRGDLVVENGSLGEVDDFLDSRAPWFPGSVSKQI